MEREFSPTKIKAPERVALAAALALTGEILLSNSASAEGKGTENKLSAQEEHNKWVNARLDQIVKEVNEYNDKQGQIRAVASGRSSESVGRADYNHGARNPTIDQVVRIAVGAVADIFGAARDAIWSHPWVLLILPLSGRVRRGVRAAWNFLFA